MTKTDMKNILKASSKAALAAAACLVPVCLFAGESGAAWVSAACGCAAMFLFDAGWRLTASRRAAVAVGEDWERACPEPLVVENTSMEEPSEPLENSVNGNVARHLRLVVSNP